MFQYPENLVEDLGPLFESIIRRIPGPHINEDGTLQMPACYWLFVIPLFLILFSFSVLSVLSFYIPSFLHRAP